jgi:uncharacterized membrane protein YvbJ
MSEYPWLKPQRESNFSYSNNNRMTYARLKRRQYIRNISFIIISFIIIVVVIGVLGVRNAKMMNNRETIISNFKNSIVEYKERKSTIKNTTTPQCINGRMVIIIDGVTYYAGTINTWGDVIGGTCK